MVQFNLAKRDVCYKIIYYGPPKSGKTANLKFIQQNSEYTQNIELGSIAVGEKGDLFLISYLFQWITSAELTHVFNCLLYQGDRLSCCLKNNFAGCGRIVLVADSVNIEENLAALQVLEAQLSEQNITFKDTSVVVQWNKRDVPGALSSKELQQKINYINSREVSAALLQVKECFRV